MNIIAARRLNEAYAKLFENAQDMSPKDIDMALLTLSEPHKLDDDFASNVTSDYQSVAYDLGIDLDDRTVGDMLDGADSLAKDYQGNQRYANGTSGMDLIDLNAKYLQDELDSSVGTIYSRDEVDTKWQQAMGEMDKTVEQADAFNNVVKSAFAPQGNVYDELNIDVAESELFDEYDIHSQNFVTNVKDSYTNAVANLWTEELGDKFGGADVVAKQAKQFQFNHSNDVNKASFADLVDDNAKALEGQNNAVTRNDLDKNFKEIRDYSNAVAYGDDVNEPVPETKKPDVSKTMAGSNVELMVNSLRPIHYKNKAGEQQLGVLVDASKRGDVANQPSKFDGSHVVNTYTSYGKESHVQLVTPESAKKIMAVNGYDGLKNEALDYAADKKYDYGKELSDRGHTMTFTANVFSPEEAKYGDFKFNPNPETIKKSEVDFNEDKHASAVSAREIEHEENKAKLAERKAEKNNDKNIEP